MCKKGLKCMTILLAAGMMVFLSISQSPAFQTVSLGDTGELDVYGFLRNNYGYFLEDQDYTLNDDKLATNRTWLRTNIDWKMSDTVSLFASVQFVYEPEYDIEEGSVSKPDGKEYSEYDDIDDVLREFYIDWDPSSNHNLRIGRQIVIWGESLTTQVGDVVNPVNNRFTFAFANWEDTRIPLWMVKGLHYFDNISTSLEWLFSPNLVGEEYRVNRSGESAQPAAGEMVSQRFAIHPEDRFLPPYAVGNDDLHAFPPGTIVANPFSRGWLDLSFVPGIPGTGWVPTEIPNVIHEYPDDGMDDARFGFRTSTFLGGYEFGISYYHTQIYNPVVKRTDETFPSGIPDPNAPQIIRNYYLVHPDVDYIGAYFNKDINVGLIRAEAIYAPNMSFNAFDPAVFDAIVERDYIKYMIAWDLSGALYFDWHKSAPFDISIEHVAEYVPDNDGIQNAIYGTELKSYKPSIGGRITTNWFYNLIQTDLIVSYGFKGKDGLIMPLIKWTPAWKNRAFSAELRYIGLFGDNDYEDLGMFRQKDMVVLTTQFNF
jgi:hypothetical protein